ncbi:MAG: 30S ribosomal protein S12 methylthiotransferase RimO [Clostridia bacterium]
MNVGLITLGCSKNQIDSEMILGYLKEKGMNIVNEPKEADILIVNTCGFINSAKEEAINTLLEMADYKDEKIGKCKCLIATGCMAKRYKNEIYEQLEEVDLVIGVDEYANINKIIEAFFKKRNLELKHSEARLEYSKRIVSTVYPMAYLRISDGCDNKCAYCAIPLIRGKFISRSIEDIVEEAKSLVKRGIRELNVISQDTSRYGLDLYGEYKLAELLKELVKIEDLKWIRVLYMYPSEITDELIDVFNDNDKICNYFDIPIQHISDKLLVAMNRRGTKKDIYDVISKIRNKIKNATIRTTLIVGFPGETDADFEELKQSIKELKFERMGCFAFSKEEDTPAWDMEDQVDEKISLKREAEIMKVQMKIAEEKNKAMIGETFEVLVESISEDEEYFVARSYMDAPDVDDRIYIKISDVDDLENLIIGDFYKVKIIAATAYDLYAEIV